MNRGYDWRLGKVRSIATDGKVIYDTALSKYRLSDALEAAYDPILKLKLGTLLNQNEPETDVYLTGLTTELSAPQITKINNFIETVKTGLGVEALSDVFDFMYLLAGETEESALRNLVKRAHDATNVSATLFTAGEGFTGDGIADYLNTNYNANTQKVNFAQNSAAFGCYLRNSLTAGHAMGILATQSVLISPRTSGTFYYTNNKSGSQGNSNANSIGLHVSSRTASNVTMSYKNGAKLFDTSVDASEGIPNGNLYILGRNSGGNINTPSAYQVAFAFAGRGLTAAENRVLSDALDAYLGINQISVTTTKASANQSTALSIKGIVGSRQVVIFWGDGASTQVTMDGALNVSTHQYTAAGTYTIKITSPTSLDEIKFLDSGSNDVVFDITEFNKATNLKKLEIGYGTGTGTVNGLPLTLEELMFTHQAPGIVASGDVTRLSALKRLTLIDMNNTVTGVLNITNHPNLARVYLNGIGVMSLDVTGLNFTYIEGNGLNKAVGGSLDGHTALKEICDNMTGGGSYSGDISGFGSHLTYLDVEKDNTITGSITGLTLMTRLIVKGQNTLTGNIGSMPSLSNFDVSGAGTVDKVVSVAANPILCLFIAPSQWTYTSAEINQVLADIRTNKDAAYSAIYDERSFDLRGNAASQGPTGQGITDKAYLETYHSPTPPGTAAVWTIYTR